jgi:hypothetical protein
MSFSTSFSEVLADFGVLTAIGMAWILYAIGESASSFRCVRWRQLYHHMSGELRTASSQGSSHGRKNVLSLLERAVPAFGLKHGEAVLKPFPLLRFANGK